MAEPIGLILEQELGKLGARAAQLGLRLDGPQIDLGASATARGASRGARFVAQRLPNDVYAVEVQLGLGAAATTLAFMRALAAVGQDLGGDPERPDPVLRAVVFAGFGNMNPAVVEVEIAPAGEDVCLATIRATAKEGLIKQRTAPKAVRRVLESAGLE